MNIYKVNFIIQDWFIYILSFAKVDGKREQKHIK